MPTPTIPDGELFFNATTYSGNGTGSGSTQTIVNGAAGASFQPDFIWIKSRTTADFHNLNDIVRGIVGTGSPNLFTNTTGAEATFTGFGVSALNSNGFNLIGNGSYTNASGTNYVAWQWKAGGTAVTNTAGSITSQVSANTTSGFSIVTYTGTGSNATVGHGLGVAPSWVIVKGRNVGSTNWFIYTATQGNTKYLDFSTGAGGTDTSAWNSTSPTSTVFSVGTSYYTNYAATTYVAYCWAPIAGYSAFGSYTGNGSADGSFVYLGFRPRLVMIKRTDTTANWFIFDTARDTYNAAGLELYPNLSNAEADGRPDLDILSNGMKMRSTATGQNASGGTYVYACWAENPFKYSNAR
jgi:hypothetical protein